MNLLSPAQRAVYFVPFPSVPSHLPLTGGAGILIGVIAAVTLFAAAGIVLVVYRRRKQQED